ncbi:MAG TPA: hypothetical protein VGG42_09820 [Acidobacteriaceae bacterium]
MKRTGALLDDPANSRFSSDYLIPHIDQQYDEMDVDLERLGMQYIEHIAIVNIAANVNDLTYLLADGQALSTMKLPKQIRWKQQGQPDNSYIKSAMVDEVDEVDPTAIGITEWTFQQGSIQVTPSAIPLTAKIYFDAVSTDIYDPAQNVIRGTAHILAYRVAAYVASLNNGMGTLQKKLDAKSARSWTAFCSLVVMNGQSKQRSPRPIHRRTYPYGQPTPLAPNS